MRTLLWVTLALIGCSKSAEDKINAVKNAAEGERAHKYCELAKSGDDDVEIKYFLSQRIVELAAADVAPDATSEDLECLPKALMSANNPHDIGEEIARLHFKRSAVASLTPVYDALPAAKKKDSVLAAFGNLGKYGEQWTKSAQVAAPALLAELDKLGASTDPKFFTALIGAYAMALDKTPSAIKERYAKLAADPRMAAAWNERLQDIGGVGSEATSWKRYAPFMNVAVAELAAHNVTLDGYAARAVVVVCGAGGAECSAASGLNEASKLALRQCVNSNSSYDWAAPGKEFLAKLGGPNSDPVTLLLDEAATAQNNQDAVDRREGKREDTKTHPIWIDETTFVSFDATANKLAAMGPSVVPKLVELLKTGRPFENRVAAHALAKLDPALLAKETTALLDGYDERLQSEHAKLANASSVAAGLRALATAPGDAATNPILRALSSRDPAITAFATQAIKKRLERDAAINALFSYMAAKQEYAQQEIDIYVGLVTSYGASATAALVKNLETLLAAAGTPDKVFWAHKVVALTALTKVGTRTAADVIKKYASDQGGFQRTATATDKDGKVVPTGTAKNVSFKELTEAALKAVSTRA